MQYLEEKVSRELPTYQRYTTIQIITLARFRIRGAITYLMMDTVERIVFDDGQVCQR